MLSTIVFGKFYVGGKNVARFANGNIFSNFENKSTFSLRRKIFRKNLLITLTVFDTPES